MNNISEDAKPDAISPEGALVANTYLANACSLNSTSHELNLPTHEISATLADPMIKKYVNGILCETGFRRMEIIMTKLDELIDKKWQELEEADVGSNKDIAELLALAHKMSMEVVKVLTVDDKPGIQKNTQFNMYGPGNYGKLMKRLLQDV